MELKLGFSTGCLHKRLDTAEALKNIRHAGSDHVELGFVKGLDNEWLSKVTPTDLDRFKYVSLHAPKFGYDNNEESLDILKKIKHFNDHIRNLNLVVFHPDPIKNFDVLNEAGIPVGIENMDNRKPSFKKPRKL